MSAVNLGELFSTTLAKREPKMADNITNHNALLYKLRTGSGWKRASGGRELIEPLAYAENSSAKFYDGYETFTIGDIGEQIDSASYDWKQLGGFANLTGLEQVQNSGKYAALNLFKSRIQVLEMTLTNKAGTSVYSDGTGTNGKEFGGLQYLVSDDPTAAGTVGGIDQVANVWWRNQYNDLSGGATTTDPTNITGYMNAMNLATIRGKDKVDLILADSFMFSNYEESLQQFARYNSSKMADAGFEAYRYKGADVCYDDQCPTDHMYFINTSYLYMQHSPKQMFTVGKTRQVDNADYEVTPVLFYGNLTCSNRARQGVIIGKST